MSCAAPNFPGSRILSVGEFAEGFGPAQQKDCWLCPRHYTVLDLERDIAWMAGRKNRQIVRLTYHTICKTVRRDDNVIEQGAGGPA